MLVERSKKVLTADFSSAKVAFDTRTRVPYILNNTASQVWELCRTPKNTGELARRLTAEYGISAPNARRDIKRIVMELKKRGLVKTYERTGKIKK